MIVLKVAVQDEVVDSEQALNYNNNDIGFEYDPIPAKKKQGKKIDDESDCKVISEEEYNKSKKKSPKATVEESGNGDEQDRVLHTSFNLSPYAINLIGMVKRGRKKNTDLRISSKNKVILDITSVAIFAFFDIMKDRYILISDINQLAAEINASSGKVTIIQPKLKIDLGKEEENERIDALILSSVMTRIKMMSEEFGVSVSCIAEFLIYMYVCDSENPVFEKSKLYCEERMNSFTFQLDKFILESTQTNIEDENALIRIGFKMAASSMVESTRINNNFKDIHNKIISVDMGSDYNINTKVSIRMKSGKRNHDESHSKGIFKQKGGGRPRKTNEDKITNNKRTYDESHSKGIFKQKTGRKSKKSGEEDV